MMAQWIEAVVANRTETVTLGSKNSMYRFSNLGIQALISEFRDFLIFRAARIAERKEKGPADGTLSFMVVGGGLEPSAHGFSVRCSTN